MILVFLTHCSWVPCPRRSNKGKTSELTDVLLELIECGITRIVDDILLFLSRSFWPRQVRFFFFSFTSMYEPHCFSRSCMQVSHNWHEMVTSRRNIMNKVTSYRKLCLTRAENGHKGKEGEKRGPLPRYVSVYIHGLIIA